MGESGRVRFSKTLDHRSRIIMLKILVKHYPTDRKLELCSCCLDLWTRTTACFFEVPPLI